MAVAPETDQRSRILETALAIMSEVGAQTMSMRQLASACGLNPATLYHYFPSKADLLQSVIEERRYPEQLASERPPADPSRPPKARLAHLVHWLLHVAHDEDATWRLIMGESIRGDAIAQAATAELVGLLDSTFTSWLAEQFPELERDPAIVARVLRNQVIAALFVDLLGDEASRKGRFRQHADDIAAIVFP